MWVANGSASTCETSRPKLCRSIRSWSVARSERAKCGGTYIGMTPRADGSRRKQDTGAGGEVRSTHRVTSRPRGGTVRQETCGQRSGCCFRFAFELPTTHPGLYSAGMSDLTRLIDAAADGCTPPPVNRT